MKVLEAAMRPAQLLLLSVLRVLCSEVIFQWLSVKQR